MELQKAAEVDEDFLGRFVNQRLVLEDESGSYSGSMYRDKLGLYLELDSGGKYYIESGDKVTVNITIIRRCKGVPTPTSYIVK